MTDLVAHENWMKDFVARARVMQPVGAEERFAHNTDELLYRLKKDMPCQRPTLVLDEPEGRGDYNGALHSVTTFGFWILMRVKQQDWANENATVMACEAVARKIKAKMLHEYETDDEDSVMRFLDPGSISYSKAGPEIDNLFGVYYRYTLLTGEEEAYTTDDYMP